MLRRFRLEEPESVTEVSELLGRVGIGEGVCRRHGAAVGHERGSDSVRAAD